MKLLSEAGYAVHGCDTDDKCVEMSGLYGKVQKLSVEEVSPEKFDGKFNCVVSSHVLEHVENPREALKRLATICRGIMVVAIPNPHYSAHVVWSLFRRPVKYTNTGHLYGWGWSDFKTFVEVGCGQEVLDWFYDSVALPAPRVIRVSLNRVGVPPFVEKRLLNALFPRFCRSITAVIEPRSQT